MIETPRTVDAERELAAVIRLSIPRSEMQSAFPKAVHEILDALNEQENPPIGPPWAYHFRLDPEAFDFEVGFPTAKPVTPVGRVQAGELPAGPAVRTVYTGPYEGLPGAWQAFQERVSEEGVAVGDAFWERYVLGPESTDDPEEYRTELNWAVQEGS